MNMFRLFAILIISATVVFSSASYAQSTMSAAEMKQWRAIDDSLLDYGNKMLDMEQPTDRLRADSMFTRLMVRALVIPHSFYNSFDSMNMAPVMYPPDSSFRIITWHVPLNLGNFRQKGVIQMNTPDGSLRMFPLFDVSDYDTALLYGIRKPGNWVGAVYYRILQNEREGKKVYTLLGYDENGSMTTRKWIDFLHFDEKNEPLFGGNFMQFSHDSIYDRKADRYMYEYKKLGNARLNFDDLEEVIVLDHLISETGEPEKKYTLIPGGDYETFKWDKGSWVHNNMWFMERREDGNVPAQMTILDDFGNFDQSQLDKQNAINLEKELLNMESEEGIPTEPAKAEEKPATRKKAKTKKKD